MLKRVLLIGAGAAAGWFGHSLINKSRDTAAIRAEESLRTTFAPENIGRNAGRAAATATAEGVRSFIGQLREEVPAWTSHEVEAETTEQHYADGTVIVTGTVTESSHTAEDDLGHQPSGK